jgi:hypothetical protein
MRRLRIVPPPGGPVERRPKERVTVHLKNGQSYSAEVTHPRRISNPEGLERKFFTCVQGSLSPEAAARVRDTILNLENLYDIAKLLDYVHL